MMDPNAIGARARLRVKLGWAVALMALLIGGLTGVGEVPSAAADTTTYTAQQTIPVPPASNFSGSAGGDGWNVALSPTAVYNVFHHSGAVQVACHLQTDASNCWPSGASKTITDAGGAGFASSSHSGVYLNQSDGKLYTYATSTATGASGVVCIDTTQPAANLNPFCGFTATSAASDFGTASNGMVAGTKLYAFNFVSGSAATGTRNAVMCFDMATSAACAGQPYAVSFAAGTVSVSTFPVPSTANIGGKLIIPVGATGGPQVACFDSATNASCTGSWPVAPGTGFLSSVGAPFPLLNSAGGIIGVCLPDSAASCYTTAGAPTGAPAGLGAAIGTSTGWNGPAVTIGNRIYTANGNSDSVRCYDFALGAQCANFPHATPGAGFLYTVNADPARPSCLWVNADFGSAQIQNFDAFSGGACGEGPIRVLAASFVPPVVECIPLSYTKLQVLDPPRAAYTSGSVAFRDGSGNPIPAAPDAALDGTGSVNLTGLTLGASGLPQFLITLTGLAGPPPAVTVEMTWTGPNIPACGGGTTVTATKLKAHPLILEIRLNKGSLGVSIWLSASATLKDSAGNPVAGKLLTFTAGKAKCTGITNASGTASCFNILSLGFLGALLNLGYDVSFAGDATHGASSAHGPLVNLFGLKIK